MYDLLYVFYTNFDLMIMMMRHLWDTLKRSVTLIWPLKVIQGQKVNWKIIYDFVYVLHTTIDHIMHRFWDIGLNR